jgi:hypothetical protein
MTAQTKTNDRAAATRWARSLARARNARLARRNPPATTQRKAA